MNSPEDVFLFGLDLVDVKEPPILILEGDFRVMLSLRLDVTHGVRDLRLPDGEGTIAILPCEALHAFDLCGHPLRGLAFEALHYIAQGKRGWHAEQQMHMIIDAADLNRCDVMSSTDATELAPHVCFHLGTHPAARFLVENTTWKWREVKVLAMTPSSQHQVASLQ